MSDKLQKTEENSEKPSVTLPGTVENSGSPQCQA